LPPPQRIAKDGDGITVETYVISDLIFDVLQARFGPCCPSRSVGSNANDHLARSFWPMEHQRIGQVEIDIRGSEECSTSTVIKSEGGAGWPSVGRWAALRALSHGIERADLIQIQ